MNKVKSLSQCRLLAVVTGITTFMYVDRVYFSAFEFRFFFLPSFAMHSCCILNYSRNVDTAFSVDSATFMFFFSLTPKIQNALSFGMQVIISPSFHSTFLASTNKKKSIHARANTFIASIEMLHIRQCFKFFCLFLFCAPISGATTFL